MKLAYFVFFLVFISSCTPETQEFQDHFHLECSGEKTSDSKFVEGSEFLNNANCRSNAHSRTGQYGFKLNSKQIYGPTYKLKSIKKGDVIYASVWRLKGSKSGKLVIGSKSDVQYESGEHVVNEQGDWEQLKCSFIARQNYEYVSVYIWNPNKNDVYFDDLIIDCFRNRKKPSQISEKDILRINIPQSALDSIADFRKTALQQDIISSELKTYFDGSIKVNGESRPVSLRIKGDWVDHLEGDKWSFRIKLKGSNSYHGMKKFSIQDPSTRSFMMEWFAHRLFEKEDILTTRYQFKLVYINGVNKGVYALEEHFDKRLLEYRNRREGPIVKFDESGIWQARLNQKETGSPFKKYPYLESSEVLPFSKKRTRKNEALLKQFMMAKSHMGRYRNFDKNIHEYMDVDKMARFIALCELMNATHGLIWHNQRNYLNPVKACLEPIAYDCFKTDLDIHKELLGKAKHWRSDADFTVLDALFLNPTFDKLYVEYLKEFTQPSFLQNAYQDFNVELGHFESLLSHEYPMHKLDRNYFETNRKNVEEKILEYEQMPAVVRSVSKKGIYQKTQQDVVFDKAALNVYTIESDSLSCTLQFENFLLADIEIIGYSTKMNKKLVLPLSKSIKIEAYRGQAQSIQKAFGFRPKNIYYKTSFTGDSLIKSKVSAFPSTQFVNILGPGAQALCTSNDSIFVMEKGIYTFSSTVVFPRDKKLIIKEGARINLKNNARFVSYSPVEITGSKENPVEFFSTDQKGGGLVIIPDGGHVDLKHVKFSNVGAGNTGNWILTGAVTIYEGDVAISNCIFKGNTCEDALNLIRCDFDISESVISDTQSDGFDADFCQGTISKSQFRNTGNDCIDFSGSKIKIESCQISGSGDKGISGGEGSILEVINCEIENASIAIASKDNSDVLVRDTDISNCNFAFAAYQKKAEFGPSKLIVESANLSNVSNEQLIELDSKITFKGKQYVGTESFDIDSMYSIFTKSL